MRIIAGSLKGRNFDSPRKKSTHPMSEKGRGALFNALGDLHGLTVLDAFTGSGACAFEAVSRGAQHVTAIDIDSDAIKTVAESVNELGVASRVTIRRTNIASFARSDRAGQYDVVLADPPYNDIRPDVVERVGLLTKTGGVFVLSWPGKEPVREFQGLEILNNKTYGDAQLVFYRRR